MVIDSFVMPALVDRNLTRRVWDLDCVLRCDGAGAVDPDRRWLRVVVKPIERAARLLYCCCGDTVVGVI